MRGGVFLFLREINCFKLIKNKKIGCYLIYCGLQRLKSALVGPLVGHMDGLDYALVVQPFGDCTSMV